jgi:hypothetical protein
MSRRVLAVALAVAAAMPVWAENQNGLTPTDILGAGEITATAQLSAALGQGKLSHPVVDLDIDSTTFQVQLSAAVGLGLGFEVELGIPYQFSGITKGDGTWLGWDTRTEEKADGFGDLTLAVNYRILKEDAALPQWIAGAIVVMPSGNDKRGDTSWEVSGVTIQDGKRGGIGDGVWKYGLQTAVSKRFGLVEPYAGFRYIFGGDRKRNGVDEERADVGSLLLGSEFHASPAATIDVRALVDFVGKDVTEDGGAESTEEAHVRYGFQATAYVDVAPSVTLLAGLGVTLAENHALSKEDQLDIKDSFSYYFMIGIHVNIGIK